MNGRKAVCPDGDILSHCCHSGSVAVILRTHMGLVAKQSSNQETLAFRTRYREEMNCQITKDSIHTREGWTRTYLLERHGVEVGFGTIAIAGPWKDKPTVIEFYVQPDHRQKGFDLFEAFMAASCARFFEAQTNDTLLTVLVHT